MELIEPACQRYPDARAAEALAALFYRLGQWVAV
jgi:hypothetical protein